MTGGSAADRPSGRAEKEIASTARAITTFLSGIEARSLDRNGLHWAARIQEWQPIAFPLDLVILQVRIVVV